MVKVSLIVPTYKCEEWIGQCLASIDAQNYKGIELIVIDDQEGTGAAMARNRGLDKATGDYIAFCDADDYLAPDAIEVLVDAMNGVEMAVGSFRKFGNFETIVRHPTQILDMQEVANYSLANLSDPISHQMLSGCWAKMYRATLIGRFPALTTAEDMAFNFDYLTRCNSVKFIENIVYHNRKRAGSITTTFNEKDRSGLFGFLGGLKYMRKFLEPYCHAEDLDDLTDNSKVYHAMLYFMRICALHPGPMRDVFRKLYP